MGFSFRRSIKIAPGVRLNFSKSGVSTSLGTRGARVTLGHGKVRKTIGIPGTGVSYTESESIGHSVHGSGEDNSARPGSSARLVVLVVVGLVLIVWAAVTLSR